MNTRSNIRLVTALMIVLIVGAGVAPGQTRDDAIRFSEPGLGVGARSLGMGNAYTGIANDYSALYWNPAGLSQVRMSEFSAGLSTVGFQNTSTFFGAEGYASLGGTNVNAIGLLYAIPTTRGGASVAFGYQRHSNFRRPLTYEAFNPLSTIVQTWAPNGEYAPPDTTLAENLGLASVDASGRFVSPINDSLTQAGNVTETGGVDYWSFGGAVDIAKNISVGLTLTYVAGSYHYERAYRETDTRGVYASPARYPYDIRQILSDEYIDSDIAGFTTKLGLLYREPGFFRLGVAVQTPMWMTIRETFGTKASSEFYSADANGRSLYSARYDDATEYDVHSPWIFSAGTSLVLGFIVLSADADWIDWTTTEFADAPQAVMDENRALRNDLRGALRGRGGVELDLSFIRLRAGVIYNQSPYKDDPAEYDQKYLTAGLGIRLGQSAMLDAAYARGWWNTSHINNDTLSPIFEDVLTNTVLVTLSVRF
jgi:long-subunit fatty acid transport protein